MSNTKRVYIAGHRGLAGTAVYQEFLADKKYEVIVKTHAELDLEDRDATFKFFEAYKPDYVVLCAAKVGGILANNNYPADFLVQNLRIQLNVFDAAFKYGVDRMIFLGSSCIYPKEAKQPIDEEQLLTGPLEFTNRPYAIAKIAGVEACWSYNRQFGTKYLALMPTNLYGVGDNYHPENSHVFPALIRKFHEAKVNKQSSVTVWGSGTPRREFLCSTDLGRAVKFFLDSDESDFVHWIKSTETPPLINIGYGEDVSISELANVISKIIGFEGAIEFDRSKPDGTMRKLMDSTKARGLGWNPTISLEEGVKIAYEDFLLKHTNS